MKANNISRRDFGKHMAAAGAALGLGLTGCSAPQAKKETLVGIQLYTVRELTKEDFAGTLRKVAGIGYNAFEFAGYGGMTAKEVKALIDELGVVCAGTHTGFGALEGDLQKTIEYNLELGNKQIVCPSMPRKFRDGGVDGIKAFGEQMNTFGQAINKAGMQLAYHNHAFEFETVVGKYLYDIMLENTQPDLVKLEADLFWVKKGGLDPVEYMKTYKDRCTMLHMKDMAADEKGSFAPVGTGIMDFPAIVKIAREIGVEWFIVEQDRCEGSVLEAITTSFNNMNTLLNG